MSRDIDEVSFTLRAFEALPFIPRSADEAKTGVVKETDAHAALQSELAIHGVARMTPETAATLFLQFGVEGDCARAILIELWQHAYKKLLFRDDHIDRGEDDYLDALQRALGLTRDEIRLARAEVPDVERGSPGE
ncbi:MAG: hypothetical protein ACR2NX_10730 [Chthoniobacterales bacterium]